MVRLFGIFDRKKQISSGSCARSSVHPSDSHGQQTCMVKSAKIIDRLGPSTPEEVREVKELLRRGFVREHPSDNDSVTTRINDENGQSSSVRNGDQCIEQGPSSIVISTTADIDHGSGEKYHRARPGKLLLVDKNKATWTTNRESHPHTPHGSPSDTERAKNFSCVDNSPCKSSSPPPPFEKHYLPTPVVRTVEEISFIAHPLPQPPSPTRAVVIGRVEHRGPSAMFHSPSCEALMQSHIDIKECETSLRVAEFDFVRKTMQKAEVLPNISRSDFLVLGQGQHTMSLMAPQPELHHPPQNIPPPMIPLHVQRTPQSTPSTPRSVAHCIPQYIPSQRSQCRTAQNLQETPASTNPWQLHQQVSANRIQIMQAPLSPNRLQLHQQVPANRTQMMHAPLSPSRWSPRPTSQAQNRIECYSPPEQGNFVHSMPPGTPLPMPLCPRNWTKGKILGQGSFGTVYEGLNLDNGSFFAVKVSHEENVSPEIPQEVEVLSKLDHPNIVRYLGSSIEERRLCIFLELVSKGSLGSNLRNYRCFGDHMIRNYTKQILLGLNYLHQKRTIHRDIKCANILVDVSGQVKLADFGIAKQVGESLVSSVKGTPLYMAPEVLSNGDCYSFPADIWSLGCTVLEMADGKPPWSDLEGYGFLFKVKQGVLPPLPDSLSSEGKDFIQCCLRMQPKDRPTAAELLRHPFVLNAVTPQSLFTRSAPPSPFLPTNLCAT
ncbi:hypothetical protein KP509_16G075000 [Ceratopteris richardii]|uniref:mitogen-activated protein kinase kinase kinase n=1 Tax=Ceratopteris richardii TaxID=49495 RepID=A0A8T2T5Q9_CERRI|nr:hypothetical protein KP509_16G075000 [Ceratopteris richardii]